MLREHLRVVGSGETIARYYRDKLAMRVKARDSGIAVPEFRHVLNYDRLKGIHGSRARAVGAEAALAGGVHRN